MSELSHSERGSLNFADENQRREVLSQWKAAVANIDRTKEGFAVNPVLRLIEDDFGWEVKRLENTQGARQKSSKRQYLPLNSEDLAQMKSAIELVSAVKEKRYESALDYTAMKHREYSAQVQKENQRWQELVNSGATKGYTPDQIKNMNFQEKQSLHLALGVTDSALRITEAARKLSLAKTARDFAKVQLTH